MKEPSRYSRRFTVKHWLPRAIAGSIALLAASCGEDVQPPAAAVAPSIAATGSQSGQSVGTIYTIATQAQFDALKTSAFQPGDTILFQRGATFTGQFFPTGSGTAAQPIVIDATGTGAAPKINGAGLTANGGAVVRLHNSSHWHIKNLEITNQSSTAAARRGIYVTAQDMGDATGIRILNNNIHDIKGDDNNKGSGGIYAEILGTTTPTRFVDLLIDGNTVADVTRTGISTQSSWRNRRSINESNKGAWYGSTGVKISNNTVARTGGDGIVARVTQDAVIEYNLVSEAASVAVGHNVAIWPYNASGTIIQYNEAHSTKKLSGNNDGTGFDADWNCDGTIIQYNYSHNNAGGFVLVMTYENTDTIIRYNISQNDGAVGVFAFSGDSTKPIQTGTRIYNNTIYNSGSNASKITRVISGPSGTILFDNNIIYNLGTGGYAAVGTWKNNTFYGTHPASEPSDTGKLTSDPLLASPGTGGTGIDMKSSSRLPGYKLGTGSPAINVGATIGDNGDKDFYGRSLTNKNCPDRGASEDGGTGACSGAPTIVYSQNFDAMTAGTNPNDGGWSIYEASGTDVKVSATQAFSTPNALYFQDGITTASATAVKTITSQTSTFTMTTRFRINDSGSGQTIRLKDASLANNVVSLLIEGGKLKWRNASGTNADVANVTADQWYRLKLVVDPVARTYDIYFDGAASPTISGATFSAAFSSAAGIAFGSPFAGTGALWIDDIRVEK
jgi:hypothetical protein